ncbi:cupin domain-containing protein [Telmatospirillum siberiense]|uniref:Cupin domain-containing protein n=1 Tax=Telmatospirillum siberiense TaxID=382514 RepID=A0A2N3PXF7_9PROT|nr:cupin domain-containing protein [Telmatospirillum siberiense]PKU25089.1 cupin domain-containing protein [Telmatospirillum siberiense]
MSNPFEMSSACPSRMTIKRAGDGIARAPEGLASGPFLVQMLLSSRTEGEMTAMRAFIEPGVATHWHSHPLGQLLFVLDGVGLVQHDGGDVIEVRAGDCVWFPAGERHWHGASLISPFSYVSVQPVKDGTAVTWFEPVDTTGDHP